MTEEKQPFGDNPERRVALDPPPEPVTVLDQATVERALAASRRSPRRRVILPFHKSASDPLQRMLNAVQPGSYIRPHRHLDPPKAESIVVLAGAIRYLVFDETGVVVRRETASARGRSFGIDCDPGIFHTFWALEPDTLLFEVKPGPYRAADDKDFAPWAPAEGTQEAAGYLTRLVADDSRSG